jgi:hypothetical protein
MWFSFEPSMFRPMIVIGFEVIRTRAYDTNRHKARSFVRNGN